MHPRRIITCLLALAALVNSCTDFLETDLSDRTVHLRAPSDNTTSTSLSQTFLWDTLDGAVEYQFMLVSPSFDSIATVVVRDVVPENTFEATLAPGTYQWTVLGRNSAYESQGEVFNLIVRDDSTQNLANQSLQLVAPADDALINNLSVNFLWKPLPAATRYNLQVASPDFSNSTFIQHDIHTTSDNHTLTLTEGKYRWRVRAENDFSVTFYTENSFEIDRTAPAAPTPVAPANNALVTLPVTLEWTPEPNTARDSLFVYSDSLLTTAPLVRLATTSTTYEFTDPDFDVYFWRVRSIDKAGNLSAYSTLRRFLVQR